VRPKDSPYPDLKKCQLELLDYCFRYQKSHIGSAFSTLPTLHKIYSVLKEGDKVILSNGHAASALYVVLSNFYGLNLEWLFENMGDHPKRDESLGIHCSTGSLGMGISVAVGMAIASRDSTIHCIISDGECAEGVVWESLAFAQSHNLDNLKIYVIINGWSAYDAIDVTYLSARLRAFHNLISIIEVNNDFLELPKLRAHYEKLSETTYKIVRKQLES
jgi:transketolase